MSDRETDAVVVMIILLALIAAWCFNRWLIYREHKGKR